ncbi:alcohol dehydrogenase [Chryseobacterium lactis]|uniref:Alcohol dehydrogenase n=1 Tax=Chryseobacterium lactis TaxID=1241981 RepID=A0A3G6RTK0_CHRLC|nr:zinc-binding alcohol dehydrogenase family protein [Chryseobacterium lactis]AZA81328.1 zinc-binding alcohol dehydrogenase family protein [Chryseobacterium lactis]AZB06327.1 zinc-binding alcohol dehydrogenase family protein [Chryseobacterium lactis]PNW15180.1 alcohol dehydrogenase [Chryseobacterium lactis]
MKAAVVFEKGGIPQYAEFLDPEIVQENEVLVSVKAASIKNLDRARASGNHYSTENEAHQPKIIGSDGAGYLENGNKVYFFSKKGTVAEKAVADKKMIVPIPEELDFSTAAALPNAVMGSAMALKFKAGIQPGNTVLINGATGITGRIAVQIAKLYGARKIIVTGRNAESLKALFELGADEVISLLKEDEDFKQNIKKIHEETPIDIIVDYIWGHSVEIILSALKGDGSFSHKTKLVTIGGMSGDTIQLSSQILRSTDISISGSGLGSWAKEESALLFSEIIPEMFDAAVAGKIKIETEVFDLENIESAWNLEIPNGKRLVIRI